MRDCNQIALTPESITWRRSIAKYFWWKKNTVYKEKLVCTLFLYVHDDWLDRCIIQTVFDFFDKVFASVIKTQGTSMRKEVVIPYRTQFRIMVISILFFSGFFALVVQDAIEEQSIILLLVCLTFVLFVVGGIWVLFVDFMYPQKITLTEEGLWVPLERRTKERIFILYSNISHFHQYNIHGQDFIDIEHANGQCTIPAIMMTKENFSLILQLLTMKIVPENNESS